MFSYLFAWVHGVHVNKAFSLKDWSTVIPTTNGSTGFPLPFLFLVQPPLQAALLLHVDSGFGPEVITRNLLKNCAFYGLWNLFCDFNIIAEFFYIGKKSKVLSFGFFVSK